MSFAPLALDALRDRLATLTLRDERRLRTRLDQACRRPAGDERDRAMAAVAAEADRAEAVVQARRDARPEITYPEELPITARHDDLLAAIRDHQVVVVAGETGSGKSTQLPKLCLELGRGVRGLIGHTQPRRVAARSVAERVASELGTELGGAVGYTVRFTDRVGDRTLVKVMTDGILLAETQRDRDLLRYDTIIVDEAHERSLNIDFLLGYLHQLLARRPELKLVITSATIDTARFSQHFGGAPVVEVTGRTYPVEVRYRPIGGDDGDERDDRDQVTAICDAVAELADEGPGDVLVFVSGEREIHDAADALRRLELPGTDVLPLYARLSAAEQHRVFEPHRGRRIVLSTNVAETSLTVPGVRYVVDAGTARISRYSRRLKVQRLPIEPISQASANQRAGRCGRVAPGICIRLYDEADYESREAFTEPEILRTNLASVILQMAALGLGDVAAFPFVEPPDARSVTDGVHLLEELGALRPDEVDLARGLTPLGRRLAQLPLDPRLGRMVLEAEQLGCVREVMVIAAALSIQDPRERPQTHQQAADEAHRRFATEGSDFVAYVRLWDYLRERQREVSGNQFRKLCKTEFLNYLRVREWQDLYSQLRQVASGLGLRLGAEAAHPDHVHRALLAGLLSQIGMREGTERDFRGARNARFAIANGSVLARKPPRWVMAGELVETNRLWARVCAPIQPEWAERTAAHLVKCSYGEPRWDARRGAAVVPERVTLYGLPVVAQRPVDLSRLDAGLARQLFLRHALVEGDWPAPAHRELLAANRVVLAELEALEDRSRGRRALVADDALYAFYERRVPADVTSGRGFDRWWRDERVRRADLLTATRDDLVRAGSGGAGLHEFPDRWVQGDLVLPVSYRFEPGAPFDGVTLHVPVALLDQVRPVGFDWQVPGMREELVETLARTLPKPVRRQLVPVAEAARRALTVLDPSAGRLIDGLAAELGREAGLPLTPGDFRVEDLPDHLRLTFSVDDERGGSLAHGKDLAALQAALRPRTRAAIARAAPTAERTGLRDWGDLGELPREVASTSGGHTVRAYPALVDEGATVGVRVLTTPAAQARAMRAGTRRLLALTVAAPRKAMERAVTNDVKLALARLGRGAVADLLDECVAVTIDAVVDAAGGPAWDADSFGELQQAVREGLADRAAAVAAAAAQAVVAASAVQARLAGMTAPALQPAVADVRSQVTRLVGTGALRAAGLMRLDDIVRYLRAADRRLERLPTDPVRDQRAMRVVHDLEDGYAAALAAVPPDRRGERHAEVVWSLEELRVSLFAQQIRTARPVSEQRVRKEIAALRDA